MFIQSESKKRLTLDVIGQLEDDLELQPLNYAKWSKLIQQVLLKDKEEQVRAVFSKYLAIFKSDVCILVNIKTDMNHMEFVEVFVLYFCFIYLWWILLTIRVSNGATI